MEQIGFQINVSRAGDEPEVDIIRKRIFSYIKEINNFLLAEYKEKQTDLAKLNLSLWYLDEVKWLLSSVRGVSIQRMDQVEEYLKGKQGQAR